MAKVRRKGSKKETVVESEIKPVTCNKRSPLDLKNENIATETTLRTCIGLDNTDKMSITSLETRPQYFGVLVGNWGCNFLLSRLSP